METWELVKTTQEEELNLLHKKAEDLKTTAKNAITEYIDVAANIGNQLNLYNLDVTKLEFGKDQIKLYKKINKTKEEGQLFLGFIEDETEKVEKEKETPLFAPENLTWIGRFWGRVDKHIQKIKTWDADSLADLDYMIKRLQEVRSTIK